MFEQELLCRVCGGKLHRIHTFGNIFLPDITTAEKLPVTAPISIAICEMCDLIQLESPIDRSVLFRNREWYRRDLSCNTVKMIHDAVKKCREEKSLKSGDWVLDIGANDGTLLSMYPGNINTFGVSPAINLRSTLEKRCTKVASDFFNGNYGIKFKIITSLWTLSRTEDVNRFVSRISLSLDDDGLLVLQFYDIVSLLKNNAVDIFRHEELIYPSTEWVISLLKSHGIFVYDAEVVEHEGGCIRIYASKERKQPRTRLLYVLERERKVTDNLYSNIEIFRDTVSDIFKRIRKYCKNKSGYVVGAFSRGSTLLQYLNVYSAVFFKKALEINDAKFGKVLAGTSIEVVQEDDGIKDFPEYILVLPWYLKEYFIKKYFKYLYAGGKLLIPLPYPEICSFERRGGIGDVECTPL